MSISNERQCSGVCGAVLALLALLNASCGTDATSAGASGASSAAAGSEGGASGSSPVVIVGGAGTGSGEAGASNAGNAGSVGGANGASGSGAEGGSRASNGGQGGNGGQAGTSGPGGATGAAGSGAGSTGSDVLEPSGGTCGTSWKNPSKQGVHDPSIVKQGDAFYLFSTGGFGYSTSKDGLTWSRGTNSLSGVPAWTQTLGLSGAPAIWACDAHLLGDKALVYYSVSSWGDVTHSAIGLLTNSSFDPAAPGYRWVDQGKVVGSPEGGSGVNVIDPDLFVDDDGRAYLVYGSFHKGVRLIELNPQTGMAKANPPNPVTLTTSLGEGSSLIKANGYYYLFVSRGHCCDGLQSTYEVAYGRSSKVTGPYLNRKGQDMNANYELLLAAGQDGNPGQGGQSFFKENGQWYVDYHAYQPPSGGSVLNIRPVYFDDSGWPTFDICKAKGYKP